MSDFTNLEKAVLDAICEGQPSVADPLRALLATGRLSERDNTGHGFYTSFDVDRALPPIDWPMRLVDGPNAEVAVDGKILLMGFILWLEDGYPSCLEGFQYGTPTGGDIDLKSSGLDAVAWVRTIF
jgi:hypothetical protein